MNGSYLHDHFLLELIERYFDEIGIQSTREFYTGSHAYSGYIDLVIDNDGLRIAIEAETTPDRVVNDVAKAKAINADLLLIVTPNSRITRSCREKLSRHDPDVFPSNWCNSKKGPGSITLLGSVSSQCTSEEQHGKSGQYKQCGQYGQYLGVWVLSLGVSLQWLRNKFPKIPTRLEEPESRKPKGEVS